MQVVHALILRETRTRFGANQLGYLWAVLEPLMWIGTFWAMYALANRQIPSDMTVVGFLGTGIVTYSMFSNTASRAGEAINANRPLLFYPQVHALDLVYARAVLEVATLAAVFAALMAIEAVVLDRLPEVDDLLYTLGGLVLAGLLGAAFGLILCMASELYPVVNRLRSPLMRPLFWASGLFFTANDAPQEVRGYLEYNPVLHAIEMVRDGWFVSYQSELAEPLYVVWWIIGFASVGLLLERVVRRKLELS
jgi:capsular polysaccharide transport system permease protein